VALQQGHAKGGWQGACQKSIDSLRQHPAGEQDAAAYRMAEYYVRLGDNDRALDSLLKAADYHTFQIVFVKVDPRFDGLRSRPRYAELLRRIGLPP